MRKLRHVLKKIEIQLLLAGCFMLLLSWPVLSQVKIGHQNVLWYFFGAWLVLLIYQLIVLLIMKEE